MGAWQPESVLPTIGPDGVPTINWSGPAGAPLDFDLVVPDGQQSDTWLGQVRTTPDATGDPVATFDSISWGSPYVDTEGDTVVLGTVRLVTTALTAGACYCYELAHNDGGGYAPVIGGSLSPRLAVAHT